VLALPEDEVQRYCIFFNLECEPIAQELFGWVMHHRTPKDTHFLYNGFYVPGVQTYLVPYKEDA
jgi:hypothetical protein